MLGAAVYSVSASGELRYALCAAELQSSFFFVCEARLLYSLSCDRASDGGVRLGRSSLFKVRRWRCRGRTSNYLRLQIDALYMAPRLIDQSSSLSRRIFSNASTHAAHLSQARHLSARKLPLLSTPPGASIVDPPPNPIDSMLGSINLYVYICTTEIYKMRFASTHDTLCLRQADSLASSSSSFFPR